MGGQQFESVIQTPGLWIELTNYYYLKWWLVCLFAHLPLGTLTCSVACKRLRPSLCFLLSYTYLPTYLSNQPASQPAILYINSTVSQRLQCGEVYCWDQECSPLQTWHLAMFYKQGVGTRVHRDNDNWNLKVLKGDISLCILYFHFVLVFVFVFVFVSVFCWSTEKEQLRAEHTLERSSSS